MAVEKLSPADPQRALKIYCTALPLLTLSESEIASISSPDTSPIATSGAGKLDFTSFVRFRELWRWAERLIWRAVILATRIHDIGHNGEDSVWTWLSHYTACSAYWPATFRTQHRSTVLTIHLRALVLRVHSANASAAFSSSPAPPPDLDKPPPWLHTARSVVQEYRAILTVSTHFPRAGERNIKVEEFVDMCVAVWEASGAAGDYANWVIDVDERSLPPVNAS